MPSFRRVIQITYAASDVPSGANVPERPSAAAVSLREAAKIVEGVAYSEAGEQPSSVVSQLIMLAADLERLSQVIERSAKDR